MPDDVTAAELRERLELYRAKYTTPTILLHLFDDAFAALAASEQTNAALREERDRLAREVEELRSQRVQYNILGDRT